jgi:hypothetical protein
MKGRPMQELFLLLQNMQILHDLLIVTNQLCEGKSPIGKHLINAKE